MEVMEDAVEPLSQSLSAVRLLLRLPGNDSTESQLEDRKTGGGTNSMTFVFVNIKSYSWPNKTQSILKRKQAKQHV